MSHWRAGVTSRPLLVAFVVANGAVGSGKETLVFLSVEGVRLAQKGYAADIREEGFAPLAELMENFAKTGAAIYVCSPRFKKHKLDENLFAGAAIVVGAELGVALPAAARRPSSTKGGPWKSAEDASREAKACPAGG